MDSLHQKLNIILKKNYGYQKIKFVIMHQDILLDHSDQFDHI